MGPGPFSRAAHNIQRARKERRRQAGAGSEGKSDSGSWRRPQNHNVCFAGSKCWPGDGDLKFHITYQRCSEPY